MILNLIKNNKKIAIIISILLLVITIVCVRNKNSNKSKENLDYYEMIDSYYEEDIQENIDDIDYNIVSEGIEIEYVDQETGQSISSNEYIYGFVGDDYDLTNQIKDIEGYRFIEIQGEAKGTLEKTKKTLIYQYLH